MIVITFQHSFSTEVCRRADPEGGEPHRHFGSAHRPEGGGNGAYHCRWSVTSSTLICSLCFNAQPLGPLKVRAGTFGVVHQARWRGLQVACKKLTLPYQVRFLRIYEHHMNYISIRALCFSTDDRECRTTRDRSLKIFLRRFCSSGSLPHFNITNLTRYCYLSHSLHPCHSHASAASSSTQTSSSSSGLPSHRTAYYPTVFMHFLQIFQFLSHKFFFF